MNLDFSGLVSVSHLAAFLSGVAVTMAGQYMGDLFTDRRRAKEQDATKNRQFISLEEKMPNFFKEMRADMQVPNVGAVREFAILPNEKIQYNPDKPRFRYHLDSHPNLLSQVELLQDAGLVERVHGKGKNAPPMFRMTEGFVEKLLS